MKHKQRALFVRLEGIWLATMSPDRANGSKLLRPQIRIQRYKNKTVGTTRVESYKVDARATLQNCVMKKKRTSRSAFFNLLAQVCFALVCAVAISAHADVITVTNTNDSGPGSLRQALADANDDDTIDFDPALNGQAIRLTGPELVIDKNISISGPGPELLAVCRSANDCFDAFHGRRAASGNAGERRKVPEGTDFRIFHVMPGHVANIAGLTISYGNDTGGGILIDQAALTVDNCTVWANLDQTTAGGGGIRSAGATANLTILNSTI